MSPRLALLVVLAALAPHVLAADFIVTSSAEAGLGSLRKAILDANAAPGADRILFAIPGDGPHVIAVQTPLPPISDTLNIEGYSQPGASPNTLADGWDAEIRIEIDAIAVASGFGLRVLSGAVGSELRGLSLVNVRGSSIRVEADDAVVAGNLIGLRADGRTANQIGHGFLPGGQGAISAFRQEFAVSARRIRIGGSARADRNLVAGTTNGISAGANSFTDPSFTGIEDVVIRNNWIGLDRTGLRAVAVRNGIELDRTLRATVRDNVLVSPGIQRLGPFPGNGIGIRATFRNTDTEVQGNRIGVDPQGDGIVFGFIPFGSQGGIEFGSASVVGARVGNPTDPTRGNVVAHTAAAGIRVYEGASRIDIAGNRIIDSGSSIGGAAGMSIDLELPTGPNSNDPQDADAGSNQLQNHPVLATATLAPGTTAITGLLSSAPDRQYRIEVHASAVCPSNLRSQAHRLLGSTEVGTNAAGDAVIGVQVSPAPPGWFVAATATDPFGNTSELGPCIAVAGGNRTGVLALSSIRYLPAEFGPTVDLVVRRLGGSRGEVVVRLRSEGGTAEPGVDYVPIDSVLRWPDGDSTDRRVPIEVLDDLAIDPDEYFAVRLLDPQGDATLGAIGGAVVVIAQDLPDGIHASSFEAIP